MTFELISFIFFLSIVICFRAFLKIVFKKRSDDELMANSKDVNTFIVSLLFVILCAFSIYRAVNGL